MSMTEYFPGNCTHTMNWNSPNEGILQYEMLRSRSSGIEVLFNDTSTLSFNKVTSMGVCANLVTV